MLTQKAPPDSHPEGLTQRPKLEVKEEPVRCPAQGVYSMLLRKRNLSRLTPWLRS